MEDKKTKIGILIVEDEMLLAKDIALRLTSNNYRVLGIVDSAEKALKFIEKTPEIDLILLDIMIKGDIDGIELAARINALSYNIPFIFLTSHADSNLVERAKKQKPYAYLLKPFNDRQLTIAIELALVNYSKQNENNQLLKETQFSVEDNSVLKIKDSLFLKKNNRYEKVLLNEIQFLEADNNYTTIYTKDDKFLYSVVLKKLEEQLPSDIFLRVHRSFIVNIQEVQGFQGNILFLNQKKIPVSKSNQNQVFKLFRTIRLND